MNEYKTTTTNTIFEYVLFCLGWFVIVPNITLIYVYT